MRDVARDEIPGSFPTARPGRHVVIGVRDNGSVMDDETLAPVFEPFVTTKGPSKGTGLGLATVHSLTLIEQHGGFLRVSSVVGIGSEFLVHIPSTMAGDVASWSVRGSEERERAARDSL